MSQNLKHPHGSSVLSSGKFNQSMARKSTRVRGNYSKFSTSSLNKTGKSGKKIGKSTKRHDKNHEGRIVWTDGKDRTPRPLWSAKDKQEFKVGESDTWDKHKDDVAAAAAAAASADEHFAPKSQDKPVYKFKKKFDADAWLRKKVSLRISETETMTLLYIPGVQVWNKDTEAKEATIEKNEKYMANVEKHKEKDKFLDRSAETFNLTTREKKIQTTPPETHNQGVQITTWDIYDTQEDRIKDHTDKDQPIVKTEEKELEVSVEQQKSSLQASTPLERTMRLPGFKENLDVLEQAVIQNKKHNEQLLFRNHKDAKEIDVEERKDGEKSQKSERLVHLWSFTCPLSLGKNVSCMCFNKQNRDLLAVGYGSFKFGNHSDGCIMFWSLKNPSYPQKIIPTKFGVISLDFSTEFPNLLAVGFYDGSVAIYDIRDDFDKPSLESMHATGKHSEPVWGVKWVSKEADKKQQNLVSISTDGSVQQWATKKGLVPHQLMQLKRIPNKEQLVSSQMDGISREASGLCFDFPVNDCTQYFAGTEGGIIHKCSVSYNEQTLENFFGHTGPVYKVKASPFSSDVFLSCSADWTCALWSQRKTSPLHVFQSGCDYMMDVEWSPVNSCVFGTVSRDGRVEVWNLASSLLDPAIKHEPEGDEKELSCVLFAPNAPVILTGASDGSIDVYRINMKGLDSDNDWKFDQQIERLNEAISEQNAEK